MGIPLRDDTCWMRQGISLLWDAEQLNRLCEPRQVISLRRFVELHASGWPEDELPFVNDEAVVVAGLESCVDALTPDDADAWLRQDVFAAVLSFQDEVADGGGQAALILWLADHRRLVYETADDIYYWHCGTEYKGQRIPLSKCLFNGAYHDLRQIHVLDGKKENWVGLYHPRIS